MRPVRPLLSFEACQASQASQLAKRGSQPDSPWINKFTRLSENVNYICFWAGQEWHGMAWQALDQF